MLKTKQTRAIHNRIELLGLQSWAVLCISKLQSSGTGCKHCWSGSSGASGLDLDLQALYKFTAQFLLGLQHNELFTSQPPDAAFSTISVVPSLMGLWGKEQDALQHSSAFFGVCYQAINYLFHTHLTLFYSLSDETWKKNKNSQKNNKKPLQSPHPQLIKRLVCLEHCSH